jgi:preprotein translocase subunit YajC
LSQALEASDVHFESLLLVGQASGPGSGGLLQIAPFFLLMFGVMYFIMIRPQQKQAQQQKAMLAALTKGDEVVTQGGMIGKIHAITDRVVTIEVANGVKVRLLKGSIQGKYSPQAESAAAAGGKAEESKDSKDAKESAKDSKEEK